MSAPPYMKLYVADYLGDTHHLGVVEHGAYLLLLMSMWRAGGSLPAADANLSKLARCTPDQWAEIKPVIMPFFRVARGRITHNRIAKEMAKYENTSGKRSEAGKRGGRKKASEINDPSEAIAKQTTKQTESNCLHNQNSEDIYITPPTPLAGEPTLELTQEHLDAPDEVQVAFDEWNALAGRIGLPTARVLSDDRRRAIKGRLKVGGLDLWREALKGVEASAFLRGQRTGSNGQPFKADLAFVCQAKSFARLVDGGYGQDARANAAPINARISDPSLQNNSVY